MSRGPYFGRGLVGVVLLVALGILLGRAGDTNRPGSTGTDMRVSQKAILGQVEHQNISEAFEGGEVHAVMGSLLLDLRGAAMRDDEAVLEVHVVMGEVEVRVPPDWEIVPEFHTFLGDARNRASDAPRTGKRLLVEGHVFMGELQVRN